jgi:hypothetical protein
VIAHEWMKLLECRRERESEDYQEVGTGGSCTEGPCGRSAHLGIEISMKASYVKGNFFEVTVQP